MTIREMTIGDYDAVWASNNKKMYCEEFENRIVAKPES